MRIRPRYLRLYTDPDVELAEVNLRHGTLEWEFPLSEAALICVDVWNWHFTRECLERTDRVTREVIAPLVDSCREHGLQVIHAPASPVATRHANWVRLVDEQERQPEWPASPTWPPADFRQQTGDYARFARPAEPQGEERNTHAQVHRDFHECVRPVGDEAVILSGEELHRLCARRGILHLFFVGFHTNACMVERDYGIKAMVARGYQGVLVRDATTGMETSQTLEQMTCTRGTIASLEQFGSYTVLAGELIDAVAPA